MYIRELSFFTGRGASLCGGGAKFLEWSEGGGKNYKLFKGPKVGPRGGAVKKIDDPRSQTDAPPLPVKNDSSLMSLSDIYHDIHVLHPYRSDYWHEISPEKHCTEDKCDKCYVEVYHQNIRLK